MLIVVEVVVGGTSKQTLWLGINRPCPMAASLVAQMERFTFGLCSNTSLDRCPPARWMHLGSSEPLTRGVNAFDCKDCPSDVVLDSR